MNISLRQIRYFIAAANAGQVSKAAIDVNTSQSVITTAIKNLEENLGTSLFDRHHSGIKLTYEGHIFLGHARHIMRSLDEALRIAKRVNDDIKGNINVAISYTVAGYFLPQLLAQFIRIFPNVNVNIFELNRTSIEDGLINGEYELAVMLTSNLVNHEKISHEVLMRSKRRLWVDAHHKFLNQESVTLADISTEPYIMLTVDEAANTAQRYWNATSFKPKIIFNTSSVEAVRSMVANGMGVSILSDMVYRPWSLDGHRVNILEISDKIPSMDVGLAWATKIGRSKVVNAFMEFMHLSVRGGHMKTT